MHERRRQTLLALAHIVRESALVDAGSKDFKAAADDIRAIINRQRRLDPETFEETAKWLNRDFDLFQDSTLLNSIYGGYVAAAGTGAAATLSPWAAMGVAFLSSVGLALPNPLESLKIAPPSDFEVLALDTWANKRFLDLAQESGGAAHIMAELFATGDISLNPNRQVSEAVVVLPESIQKLVKDRVEGTPSKPVSEANRTAQDEAKRILDKIENRVTKLEQLLANEKNEAMRALEEAAARREIEYLAAELNGLGLLGGLALTLLGDKTAARAFQTVTQAGASAWLAVTTPGLGPLAIAGALAAAASAIIGLFGEGDPLYNALEPIHKKLDYVIQRLDLVVEQQATILRTLAEIYKNLQISGASIESVKDSISAFGKSSADSDVDDERSDFVNARDDLASLIQDHTADQIAAEPVLQNQYRTNLRSSYTYGHNLAGSTAHIGSVSTGLDPGEWVTEIRRRGRVDRIVGILPGVAAQLGIDVESRIVGANPGRLVNPIAWREAVEVMLEGRLGLQSIAVPSEATWLAELWRDGQTTREVILALTSSAGIATIAARLKAAAGLGDADQLRVANLLTAPTLAGAVYRAAKEADDRETPRWLKWRTKGGESQHPDDPWRLRGRPYSNDGWQALRISFEPDFVQLLLDHSIDPKDPSRKALELVECEPLQDYQRQCMVMVRVDGPYKDSPLVPEKLALSGVQRAYPAIADDSVRQLRRPFDIQARAQSLYLGTVVRGHFGPEAANLIRTALKQHLYSEFEYWGQVARTVCALTNWRIASQQDVESLLIRNAAGPFTTSEMAEYLTLFATSRLSPSGDWPLELASGVAECIDESLDPYREVAALHPDAVYAVDEPLRRVAAYVDAKGLPPVWNPLPDGR